MILTSFSQVDVTDILAVLHLCLSSMSVFYAAGSCSLAVQASRFVVAIPDEYLFRSYACAWR